MKKESIGRDTLLFLPAKIVEGLIGIFTLSFTTYRLTTGAVDDFGTINTIVTFSQLLLISWLMNSSARYLGDETATRDGKNTFFTTVCVMWFAMNCAAWLIALIYRAFSASAMPLYAAAMFTSTSIYQTVVALLVQAGKKKASVALALTSAVLKPAVLFALCTILSGASQYPSPLPNVVAYAASELLCGIIGVCLLGIPVCIGRGKVSRELVRRFAGYGLPLMGVSLSVGLLNFVDRFILILFGSDFGIYYTNSAVSSAVFTMLMVGIMRAVYPTVLKSYRQGGAEAAKPILTRGVRIYMLISMPAAAGLCGIAKSLAALLFEESYVGGYKVIGLLAFAMFFTGMTEYAIKTWELSGNTRPIMQNALLAMVLKIIVSIILLPAMGYTGAAIGSLIAFVFYFTISALRAKKTLLFSLPLRRLANIGVSSLMCFAASFAVSTVIQGKTAAVVCAIAAGIAAYAVSIILSGEVKEEMKKLSSVFGGKK